MNDPVTFPALQIEVKAVQSKTVSASAAPVHIRPRLVLIGIGIALQLDIAVLQQPCVQVEGSVVRSEAVVRKDQ